MTTTEIRPGQEPGVFDGRKRHEIFPEDLGLLALRVGWTLRGVMEFLVNGSI